MYEDRLKAKRQNVCHTGCMLAHTMREPAHETIKDLHDMGNSAESHACRLNHVSPFV